MSLCPEFFFSDCFQCEDNHCTFYQDVQQVIVDCRGSGLANEEATILWFLPSHKNTVGLNRASNYMRDELLRCLLEKVAYLLSYLDRCYKICC